MLFLADESCDFRVVRDLHPAGHDVTSVIEIARGAEDQDVVDLALQEGRISLTDDHDFGQLVYAAARAHSRRYFIAIFCAQSRPVARLSGCKSEKVCMHAELENRRAQLTALCKRYNVARLEVFGSAARGVDFDLERSDVDFLVEFEPDSDPPSLKRFFALADALQTLLQRRIDLVEASAVRNPYIRAGIERSRELVYGS